MISTVWTSSDQFARVAGFTPRAARKALELSLKGALWRGARLTVRTVKGRGGRSGLQYEVAIDSLPDDLKDRFKAHFNSPAVVAMPSTQGAVKRSIYFALLAKPLSFPKGSKQRAQAIRQLAAQPILDPETASLKRFSVRTLHRLVAAYETHGAAALGRRRRSDTGRERTMISQAWDRAVASAPHDSKIAIRDEVLGYIRAQHKNHESSGNIAFKARLKLEELTRKLGVTPPADACAIPRSMIAAESAFRRAAMHRLDAKAFADALPGVRRTRKGMRPCQVVFGDVHHLDILLPEVEGLQRYAKAICWLDQVTNRMWMTIVILPKGEGVRNEHVIASFIEMCMAWGLPETLYLDNGSEYRWADFIEDALKLAASSGRRFIVRATPHNARAKPIESAFKNLEYHHFSKLPGWIGGDRMKAKTANVGRAPTPFSGDHDTFRQALQAALALYHVKPQGKALGGKSPIEAFNDAVMAGWTKIEVDPAAFETVFATEQTREVRQGFISVEGRLWTCAELQSYLGSRVVVLIPKFSNWSRLPIKDERGRLMGFAHEDVPYGYLDPAGARESGRRKQLRIVAARKLDASVPTIDALAETLALAPTLPKELPAPIGARLTASDEQKRLAAGIKETTKQRRARERAENERETETMLELNARVAATRRRPA